MKPRSPLASLLFWNHFQTFSMNTNNNIPTFPFGGIIPAIRTMNWPIDIQVPLPPNNGNDTDAIREFKMLVKEMQKRDEELRRQHEESEKRHLERLIGKETLFRFAYVPFVICKLVWDYAETLLDMAAWKKISATKPLCRQIRELRLEYDRIRAPFVDNEHQASEEDNMYAYEDGVNDIVRQMLLNIHIYLRSEYPDLQEDWIQFLGAVYQCDITLKALLLYSDRQANHVAKLIGRHVGHILPEPIYKLNLLVLQFVGDKPISSKFDGLKKQYIQTLAAQMALIELNDISDYTADEN